MMLASFLFLLFLTGGESSEANYIYQDVLNYLNLSSNNDLFTMSRPVKDHTQALEVELYVMLYAIVDVREVEQKFVPYLWIFMSWKNDHISWNPEDFGGIKNITIPTEALWKPDITIKEMIEKDKAPPTPYLFVSHSGVVELTNDQVLISNCRMHVYNFPFDIQSCTLSFKSVVHSDKEIQLLLFADSSEVTNDTKEVLRTQYEWQFINVTVTNQTVNKYGRNQDMIVYTVFMKRRSMLYVINVMLPVLFFLCLDLSSFLISDKGGEKLSFKITVLLAITVMQLLLNDILPASSSKIPLIALYCFGIFGFMMLSLVETIAVMYLMEKDSESQDKEADRDQNLSEDCGNKSTYKHDKKVRKWCQCLGNVSSDETPADLLLEDRKMTVSKSTEDTYTLEQVSTELKEMEKTLSVIFTCNDGERKPGYWTQKAKIINRIFFMFYSSHIDYGLNTGSPGRWDILHRTPGPLLNNKGLQGKTLQVLASFGSAIQLEGFQSRILDFPMHGFQSPNLDEGRDVGIRLKGPS
ncbi:5-hydroxytryptamine receptor 3A-like [Sphaeramia orbicularis]|uniref:5-hydroxytryptamine receptor 3A-like n=1 Tax=Sphaeramia orbicularis TaxID=375764 RepID=UPI00117E316F|nr:5-hydroxytryptamine receptor 3A-like [Sphaeramia orbicularis]